MNKRGQTADSGGSFLKIIVILILCLVFFGVILYVLQTQVLP